jgi:arginase family enzyme
MRIQILDLDGSMGQQKQLLARYRPTTIAALDWGPRIRLGCRFGRFRSFEAILARRYAEQPRCGSAVTFYGSGDFHHVSLALLRRLTTPFNLLVIDNHPDWMRGVPLMHCGTWVYHAARLPHVQRIFQVGGDVDFDNYYRWMAPWRLLREGKIVVFPAIRQFQGGSWADIPHQAVRRESNRATAPARLHDLLRPFRADLARCPLYVSLDKDVMTSSDAVVNWDSGHLTLAEIQMLLQVFLEKAQGNLIGMDIVGDWSPVKLQGLLRRFFHWTMHPSLQVGPLQAATRNGQTNLALLETIEACWGKSLCA